MVWVGPAIGHWYGMGLPICQIATIYGLLQVFGLFWCRSAAMSGSEHHAALPPEVPYYSISRRSTTRSPRVGVKADSHAGSGSSSESPARRKAVHSRHHSVNNPHWRMEHAQPQASPTRDSLPVPSWQVVLDDLACLKSDVAQLTANRAPSPQLQQVNFQVSTSGLQAPVLPVAFSGFVDSSSEDGEVKEFSPGSSVLLQAAKAFGPLDSVSEDIDPQVAAMVNFCFDKGLQEEDYKAIAEDPITRHPNNCPALAPVESNPQILGALKTDARKADFQLKEVSADIISAGSIITKSLLVLDKVAQDVGNPVVVQEVGKINGALALLGHANHRTNLARHFIMRHEINQKYAHLCSDKVPMTRFLFGDDVSQSAKQIEETEKQDHYQEDSFPMEIHQWQAQKLMR
ncbi:hypothetical protein E2C01_049247 [Portunus trituberculatus]|uniref:Uncharacterized protein n=1 Tax=Portunus trituberculatus TaxID=210409 RepID=A0A5B7GD70_PORTR|nr:hypothetical protein [Portunus trituberculatus]